MIGTAPNYINWNYTYACNFNCSHCYSRSPSYPNDLSSDQYKLIADQIVENNIFSVGFGGGEPTVRKDLVHIIRRLSEGGVETNLTSNGSLLTDKYLKALIDVELSCLLVSLESHLSEINDKIRNQHGALDMACNAIKRASSSGIKTKIACVITSINFDQLEEVVSLAESLGAYGINFKLFRASGGAIQSKHLFELSSIQKDLLPSKICDLKSNSSIYVESYQDTEEDNCSCGVTQLTIRPNGDVSLCPYSSKVIGNLMDLSLQQVWNASSELLQRRDGQPPCLSTLSSTYPYNPTVSTEILRK